MKFTVLAAPAVFDLASVAVVGYEKILPAVVFCDIGGFRGK